MASLSSRLIHCIFLSLALCSVASSAEPYATEIQGFWFGDGTHPFSKNVLLVQNDEFIVISPLGRFTSRFASGHIADGLTAIDIERYDGTRQLGVYKVDKAKLYLKLADPGDARPTIADVTYPSGKPHWHTIFDRRPTQNGLIVLHKDVSTELGLKGNSISNTSTRN